MNAQKVVLSAMIGMLCHTVPVFSQDAILPQGDPRLPDQPSEQQRDAIRQRRLEQQGQGPDLRVQGKRQGGKTGSTAGDPNGLSQQDTGIADPSVNPGQASGMRVVRGEVKQATLKTVVVEDSKGKEVTMSIDAATAGDRDIRPGDVITGTITPQGRAVAIHKESGLEATHKEPGADR